MSKDEVEDLYSMVMPHLNAQAFVDQMFKVFDTDGNGLLDFQVIFPCCLTFSNVFKEFLLLINTAVSGSLHDKLMWAFMIYDKDLSGNSVIAPNLPNLHVPRLHICEGDGGGAGHCLWTGGVQPGEHDGVE